MINKNNFYLNSKKFKKNLNKTQKIFNEQPKNYVYCEQCDEMYYQSKMYYDYEKQDDINNS